MKTSLCYALGLFGLTAGPAGAGGATEFKAHEWGTFTSVHAANSAQLEWNPLIRTDLPEFVYDPAKLAAGGCGNDDLPEKAATRALIRMETPVIYFYSPTEQTVDVRVAFPQGRITEWYPRASQLGPYMTASAERETGGRQSFIEWSKVRILAPKTTEVTAGQLIRTAGANHYYAARETVANLLRMDAEAEGRPEYERLLFYRGVGNFPSPLQVTANADETELRLSTASSVPIQDLIALTIEGGQARYSRVKQVSATQAQTVCWRTNSFAPLAEVRKRLMLEMEVALVRQGLYGQEAAAMVKTWHDQWFAEAGTRVLYLLPREWTDRVLPIHIAPVPAELVRVMVGRAEIIPSSAERTLYKQIVRYQSPDPAAQARAVAGVRELGLGRFLAPAIERVLATHSDQALADAAWKLAQAAGEEVRPVAVASRSS